MGRLGRYVTENLRQRCDLTILDRVPVDVAGVDDLEWTFEQEKEFKSKVQASFEKFLIEADAYTPPAPNTAPMSPPSPFSVSLAENITKQGFAVDQILPLHGRMVPLAELHKAAGVTP